MLDITDGARNLLMGCGGLRAGQHVLIVTEPEGLGFYEDGLGAALAGAAHELGLFTQQRVVQFSPLPEPPSADLCAAMERADLVVFLARLGDQMRFVGFPGPVRALVCSALDRNMLASMYGRIPHAAMVELRDAVDLCVVRAREIKISCPAGTKLVGQVTAEGPPPCDTRTIRFPLSVHSPVPAQSFRGVVAQNGFLVGTGSAFYAPYACRLDHTLFVQIEGNRITGFDGHAADVRRARAHYQQVAEHLGVDESFVHSWHAGIHPGCAFPMPARDSFERWSSGAFGNPRLLHFHSCGAYAPGEISLNILDATVQVDGVALWDRGVLRPEALPETAAVLAAHPVLRHAFDAPAQDCGAGPCGQLSFV